MKIKIIILVCCLNVLLSTSRDLPRDEALEKPIMDLLKDKSLNCSEYKPKFQAYLENFKKELSSGDGKMCTFNCASDEHFQDSVKYCNENNCAFDAFIGVLGERSGIKMFDCEVIAAAFKLKKGIKKVMNSKLTITECKSDPMRCFFSLALIQKEYDCTKYKQYLEPTMNKLVEEKNKKFKNCKLICEKPKAKELFKGYVNWIIKQTDLKEDDLKPESKFVELFKEYRSKFEGLFNEFIQALFENSGDSSTYSCEEVKENKKRLRK